MPRTRPVSTQCPAKLKLPINIREAALTSLFCKKQMQLRPPDLFSTAVLVTLWSHVFSHPFWRSWCLG